MFDHDVPSQAVRIIVRLSAPVAFERLSLMSPHVLLVMVLGRSDQAAAGVLALERLAGVQAFVLGKFTLPFEDSVALVAWVRPETASIGN